MSNNWRMTASVVVLVHVFLIVAAPTASAHFLTEDSVDSGEIRWVDQTTWDGPRTWSIDRWNELSGGVNVVEDDAWHIADLEFKDYSADDNLCGYWDANSGADDIFYNSKKFKNYSSDEKRGCATHELGHAHRLAHSYDDQVMDNCPVCHDPLKTYPQDHDKKDYHEIW